MDFNFQNDRPAAKKKLSKFHKIVIGLQKSFDPNKSLWRASYSIHALELPRRSVKNHINQDKNYNQGSQTQKKP